MVHGMYGIKIIKLFVSGNHRTRLPKFVLKIKS